MILLPLSFSISFFSFLYSQHEKKRCTGITTFNSGTVTTVRGREIKGILGNLGKYCFFIYLTLTTFLLFVRYVRYSQQPVCSVSIKTGNRENLSLSLKKNPIYYLKNWENWQITRFQCERCLDVFIRGSELYSVFWHRCLHGNASLTPPLVWFN